MNKNIKIMISVCSFLISAMLFTTKAQASTQMQRLSGQDRYETAAAVSRSGWNTSNYVIVANGENFPDALSASPLAKAYKIKISENSL